MFGLLLFHARLIEIDIWFSEGQQLVHFIGHQFELPEKATLTTTTYSATRSETIFSNPKTSDSGLTTDKLR